MDHFKKEFQAVVVLFLQMLVCLRLVVKFFFIAIKDWVLFLIYYRYFGIIFAFKIQVIFG